MPSRKPVADKERLRRTRELALRRLDELWGMLSVLAQLSNADTDHLEELMDELYEWAETDWTELT